MAPLTTSQINPVFIKTQYAVRGELAVKAETYREQLKRPDHGLPFNKVITANIGNPQQKGLDQKPLTFPRQVRIYTLYDGRAAHARLQVAALTEYTPLMETTGIFPIDVIARARELYGEIGSIGAYSDGQGVSVVRRHVAEFIESESRTL